MDKSRMTGFRRQVQDELDLNLLPFWCKHSVDHINGGFIGEMTNDLTVNHAAGKGLILNARLLWAFSAAGRFNHDKIYSEMADYAFRTLDGFFLDKQYGGAYWVLDHENKPLETVKKTYGQSFCLYALSEYYLLTGNMDALDRAKELFGLIEKYTRDPKSKGYFEVFNQDWTFSAQQQLSSEDLDSPFSMNTHLHVMEAYMNLYSIWKDPLLEQCLRELIGLFQEKILDSKTNHFQLFFDTSWRSQSKQISFGHDIEGSWLLCRAAEELGDPGLRNTVNRMCLRIAQTIYEEALSPHGALIHESDGFGHLKYEYHFWCQAEAVVGFLNAFELSGQEHFFEAAQKTWRFIEDHQKDKKYGEWFYLLDSGLNPRHDKYKISQWKCPYHNIRGCIETVQRLDHLLSE